MTSILIVKVMLLMPTQDFKTNLREEHVNFTMKTKLDRQQKETKEHKKIEHKSHLLCLLIRND